MADPFFYELLETRKIIDPRDNTNAKEHDYFKSLTPEQQDTLKYLIPLDGWFAMIIYPSLSIKNHAQWDANYGIGEQIRRIKSNPSDQANRVEAPRKFWWGNWPIELDLDACRHF